MSDFQSKKVRKKHQRRTRAHWRVRARVNGTTERPRLSVFKSLRFIYAQVIDDARGVTLAHASSREADIRSGLEASAGSREAAKAVGAAVAERAMAEGIEKVVFDRGGYQYHGRVKELAEAAREQGLQF
ncbi:MAG: 50S ribosomal protein L18 [Acidobacteriota bacterium]